MDYLSLHTPNNREVWIKPEEIITYRLDDYGQVELIINGGSVIVKESLYDIDMQFNNNK